MQYVYASVVIKPRQRVVYASVVIEPRQKVVYASVVIEPRQKHLFRVQNWDRSSSSRDFLFRREKEEPSSARTVPAASASTPIVVPATVRSYVHRLCHCYYCCWTREVANCTWKAPLVRGFFILFSVFFYILDELVMVRYMPLVG